MPGIAAEVKQEILGKVKSGEPVVGIAKHYGISDKTIYAWLRNGVSDSVSALEYGKMKKENLVLKEIVGALTVEVEKLKKKTRRL
jgi:transposase